MRTQGAAIQGGLAALGLLLAYGTWQREPERAAGEVVVLDASKNDLTKVRFEDGAKWVELTQRKDADGPVVWLHLAKNDQAKTPEREVRGNETANKLWDKFTPLRATRALGTLDAAKLKELGLDAPKKKVEVSARGGQHVFLFGTPAFNVADPYVMDDHDKRVYVLAGGLLSDLDSAAVRLVDRAVHGFKPNELDGITVTVGAPGAKKTRELVQSPGEQPTVTKLASKKTPTKFDEQAKNWHDKLWRLYVIEVLGKGEKPAGGEPEVALRLDYTEKGKPKGWIEIGRVAAPPPPPPANTSAPTPPPAAPTTDAYIRSEHTAGWCKLPPPAEDLLKEADKIASAE